MEKFMLIDRTKKPDYDDDSYDDDDDYDDDYDDY